jgi:hypothetical protein
MLNADDSFSVMTTVPVASTTVPTLRNTVPFVAPNFGEKIAIPKIRKPTPPPTVASMATPLVLQLGNDGIYYTNTATSATLIVNVEPTLPPATFCSPLVAGVPTVALIGGHEEPEEASEDDYEQELQI